MPSSHASTSSTNQSQPSSAPGKNAVTIVLVFVVFQLGLLQWLPGKIFEGPITPAGNRPRYTLNGVPAWVITHAAFFGSGTFISVALFGPPRELLPILLLLFVGSGLCALIYEVVWYQSLALIVGSNAVSMVESSHCHTRCPVCISRK